MRKAVLGQSDILLEHLHGRRRAGPDALDRVASRGPPRYPFAMLTAQEQSYEVLRLLGSWATTVELHNAVELTDINRASEFLVQDLLNVLYDLKLVNLNEEMRAHPGVDLGDPVAGVAYQVTSDVSMSKVRETLNAWRTHSLGTRFPGGLRFFFVSTRNLRTPREPLPSIDPPFDLASCCMNLKDLTRDIQRIERSDQTKFAQVVALLRRSVHPPTRGRSSPDVPALAVPRYIGVPSVVVPYFRGRSNEVRQVIDFLSQGRRVVLVGYAGTGKTQVALRVLRDSRWQLVCWLHAKTEQVLIDELVEAGVSLGWITPPLDHERPQAAQQVASSLSNTAAAIVVIDEASDPAVVSAWISPVSSCLICSRNPQGWSGVAVALRLGAMPEVEGIALLTSLSGDSNTEAAARVFQAISGLPLTIAQAAQWCANTGRRLDSLLDRLESEGPVVLARASEGGEYPSALLAVIRLQLEELERSNSDAALLLRLLVYVPDRTISVAFLERAFLVVPQGMPDVLGNDARLEASCRALLRSGLVEPGAGVVVLHDLVRLLLRQLVVEEPGGRRYERLGVRFPLHTYADAMLRLSHVPVALVSERDRAAKRCWDLFPLGAAAAMLTEPDDLFDDVVADAANDIAEQWLRRGRAQIAWLLSVHLEQALSLLGEGKRVAALTAKNLHGVALQHLGRLQAAEQVFQGMLAECESRTGIDSGLSTAVRHNLGFVLAAQGKIGAAAPVLRRVLEARRLAGDDKGVANALESLSIASRGDPELMVSYLEEAVAIRRQYARTDDRFVFSLVNLAGVLVEVGRIDEAALLTAEAHADSADWLWMGHPWYAQLLQVDASIASARGDLDAAEGHVRAAVAYLEERALRDTQDWARAVATLGRVLVVRGRFAEGEVEAQKALRHWGNSDMANTWELLVLLGQATAGQGRATGAAEHFVAGMNAALLAFGDGSPEFNTAMIAVAQAGRSLPALFPAIAAIVPHVDVDADDSP